MVRHAGAPPPARDRQLAPPPVTAEVRMPSPAATRHPRRAGRARSRPRPSNRRRPSVECRSTPAVARAAPTRSRGRGPDRGAAVRRGVGPCHARRSPRDSATTLNLAGRSPASSPHVSALRRRRTDERHDQRQRQCTPPDRVGTPRRWTPSCRARSRTRWPRRSAARSPPSTLTLPVLRRDLVPRATSTRRTPSAARPQSSAEHAGA